MRKRRQKKKKRRRNRRKKEEEEEEEEEEEDIPTASARSAFGCIGSAPCPGLHELRQIQGSL